MGAETPVPVGHADVKKLNMLLVDELSRFSSYVSKASFLGEVVLVHFTSEPKKDAERLQRDIAVKLSKLMSMEFQFFRAVGREWWFRRA